VVFEKCEPCRCTGRLAGSTIMKKSDPEQSKRFIEAARELECDEDEDAFKARVKRLAETKPTPLKSFVKKPRKKPG
jgi:hypothetical protein